MSNLIASSLEGLGLHLPGLDISILAIASGICWYMAYKDIKLSATAMLWTELTSICLILVLCTILWYQNGFALDLAQFSLKGVTAGNIATGLVLVMFGFSGFESATSLGDEAKNPLKTIPSALILSTLVSGIFFLLTAYIIVLKFNGIHGIDLSKVDAPLSFLAEEAGLGLLGKIVELAALCSFFAGILGSVNPASRIIFTMSQYGLFPASLGSAHSVNRTPYNAVTLSSLLVFLIPLGMSASKIELFVSMGYLGTISSFGFLLVYVLICIAAPLYLRQIDKLLPQDILISVLGVLFMLFPVLGSIGIPGSSWFPVPDAPTKYFPYIFLAYLVLTTAWFTIKRNKNPDLADKMLARIEEVHDLFGN
jgi:amino acid transporter